jgi:hypothetical protein
MDQEPRTKPGRRIQSIEHIGSWRYGLPRLLFGSGSGVLGPRSGLVAAALGSPPLFCFLAARLTREWLL